MEHVVLIRRFYGQKSSLISPSKWSIGFVSYRSLDPASGDSTSLICASYLGAVPSLDVCVMSSGSIRFSIASLWGIHSRILLCRLLSVWRQDSYQHLEQAMLRDCIPDNRCQSHLEVFEGIQFTEYWNIHPARSCPLLISSLDKAQTLIYLIQQVSRYPMVCASAIISGQYCIVWSFSIDGTNFLLEVFSDGVIPSLLEFKVEDWTMNVR